MVIIPFASRAETHFPLPPPVPEWDWDQERQWARRYVALLPKRQRFRFVSGANNSRFLRAMTSFGGACLSARLQKGED